MKLLRRFTFIVVLCCLFSTAFSANIFDPSVFNFYFYINTNADLVRSGIHTQAEGEAHWKDHGISEGRQACGSFHVRQYLDRYPDLKKAFGTNYSAAIQHYLTTGRNEHRVGYLDGGGYGRYTISNLATGLFLSGSDRMGGAVDSIVFNEKELINAWDHGRELQMAVTTGHGECYNPTEAGSRDNPQQDGTVSKLQMISSTGNILQTSVEPAFWMGPGEKHANPNPSCSVALNKVVTSKYTMNKTISIGKDGKTIIYSSSVLIPENQATVQTEAPTGYMTIDFDNFFVFDLTTKKVRAVDHSTAGSSNPLIFATNDNTTALGAISLIRPPMRGYVKFYFNFGSKVPTDSTTKWTIVQVNTDVKAGTVLRFTSVLCVGNVMEVAACLGKYTE